MKYNEVAPIPKQMTIVIGLCVVGLMAFGLALSYYKNILFDRQLITMQERNAALRNEISSEYAKLQYYQSDQYKDKYAKENLGLYKSGEQVLILEQPDNPLAHSSSLELTPEEKTAIFEEHLRNIRVIDQWNLFLFHREKVDDLRRGA